MKGQAGDWKKIFIKHILDKELIFRTYKEPLPLNNKTINPIKKWANDRS